MASFVPPINTLLFSIDHRLACLTPELGQDAGHAYLLALALPSGLQSHRLVDRRAYRELRKAALQPSDHLRLPDVAVDPVFLLFLDNMKLILINPPRLVFRPHAERLGP